MLQTLFIGVTLESMLINLGVYLIRTSVNKSLEGYALFGTVKHSINVDKRNLAMLFKWIYLKNPVLCYKEIILTTKLVGKSRIARSIKKHMKRDINFVFHIFLNLSG